MILAAKWSPSTDKIKYYCHFVIGLLWPVLINCVQKLWGFAIYKSIKHDYFHCSNQITNCNEKVRKSLKNFLLTLILQKERTKKMPNPHLAYKNIGERKIEAHQWTIWGLDLIKGIIVLLNLINLRQNYIYFFVYKEESPS